MFAYELEGLKRLKIKPIKWGSSYRLKVRGRTGKMVFIGNVSQPKNQKLIAKQYKVSIDDLKKNLSSDYRDDPKYKPWVGTFGETHLYENIPTGEFYDKLENVLLSQKKAYKINLALGYTMYDPVNDEEFYFYPNIANTNVYERPFVVNSRADARKVISDIRMKELTDTLNYPKSGIKVKSINGFKIFIDYRDHALGDSDALVPEFIKNNRYIINFPRTNNKCVFYCIAYHLQEEKNRRKVVAQVKDAFKRYCSYKGLDFSLSLYKGFKPIDLIEFDHLEECFLSSISTFIALTPIRMLSNVCAQPKVVTKIRSISYRTTITHSISRTSNEFNRSTIAQSARWYSKLMIKCGLTRRINVIRSISSHLLRNQRFTTRLKTGSKSFCQSMLSSMLITISIISSSSISNP
jgi:hypothetical protein